MRFLLGLALTVTLGLAYAQTHESPEIAGARAGISQLRALVEAGAAPRVQLEKAEESLADAQDAAFLRRTLYGDDLTEEQSDEMISAAQRRLDRRRKNLEQARQLVDAGVASQISLGAFLEDQDRARKEHDLALSRARLTRELTQMAKAEQEHEDSASSSPAPMVLRFDGKTPLTPAELKMLELAFETRFARSLPVSAMGETAVHRALGFDHRNRVDVAVHPDQTEGVWLRQYLEVNRIPYFAFRRAVSGKSTGAHIHIGPGSTRIVRGG